MHQTTEDDHGTNNVQGPTQHVVNSMSWPRPTSSSHTSLPTTDTESVQGVVTTEVGVYPNNAKFAGVSSAQVLGKVAEAVAQPYAPNLNVMDFFCPTMTYAEEFPMAAASLCPLINKSIADTCVQCECSCGCSMSVLRLRFKLTNFC
jgi:hypothetical protein